MSRYSITNFSRRDRWALPTIKMTAIAIAQVRALPPAYSGPVGGDWLTIGNTILDG